MQYSVVISEIMIKPVVLICVMHICNAVKRFFIPDHAKTIASLYPVCLFETKIKREKATVSLVFFFFIVFLSLGQ